MTSQTVAELWVSQPENEGRKALSGLAPEEKRAILWETIDRHYHAILDQPVPMLGTSAHATPQGRRRAARIWLPGSSS